MELENSDKLTNGIGVVADNSCYNAGYMRLDAASNGAGIFSPKPVARLINENGAFVGAGVDVGPNEGVGCRAVNTYDADGGLHIGIDARIPVGNGKALVVVGGVIVGYEDLA